MSETKVSTLCIIGSGPAGIMTAIEFATQNPQKNVILLEYGFKNENGRNNLDDSIQINNPLNHHDPYECTNKGFGGTSQTWGGRCVMFDDIDFIPREIIGDGCTWNISLYKELLKYTSKSAQYFECSSAEFDLKDNPTYRNTTIADNFQQGVVTDTKVERWSMPTRFGNRYRKELDLLVNIELLEGVEADFFESPDHQTNVKSLYAIRRSDKTKIIIQSDVFVIAAGAQETTRLLLRNLQLFKHLKQVPTSLGKYYQGHVSGKIASVKFKGNPKNTDYGFIKEADGTYIRRRFQFDSKFLEENNLLNTAIWLDNPLYHDPNHKNGAMSFIYLMMITPIIGKKLAPPAIQHSLTKGKKTSVWPHIWNVIKDLPFSLTTPFSIFYKRYLLKRKLPGVFLYNPNNIYALHFHSEQVPDIKNQMFLSDGCKKLEIDYHLTDSDIDSVIKLHDVLDKHLQESNCGKLEYWYPKEELKAVIRNISKDGIHQSGTTRIADSDEMGVVDSNLKVFGTSNVYVCSSSVFPTSGQANPTFFLGAFAVRLADHLSKGFDKTY